MKTEKRNEATVKTLTEVFRKNLGKDKLEVKVEKLKNEGTAAMITLPEESRRMQDMMKMYICTEWIRICSVVRKYLY